MKARKSDLVALGFMIAAVVVLISFHFLVLSYERQGSGAGGDSEIVAYQGYRIWAEIFHDLRKPLSMDYVQMVVSTSLVFGVGLIITSPFVVGVLESSRVAWWTFVLCSGMLICGIDGVIGLLVIEEYRTNPQTEFGLGMACLFVFPFLNFIGLLCIRKRPVEIGVL